jgi:pyruvate/2-oxoglutarate/acetoin dehydrogenase E1 component
MKHNYIEAVRLAFDHALESDPAVMLFGLGVGDVGAVFGTTSGLQAKYGEDRVFDIPLSENAVTGIALGLAIQGLRPIMVHQRSDFSFTSAEQIINQISKTKYMSKDLYQVPIVIRMIVGRGWGQGPTHSQAPHAIYSHVPGLRVVAPSSPSDGYQLMRASISSDEPVIFLEHRWLHQTTEEFNIKGDNSSLEQAKIVLSGSDLSLISLSYGVLECLKIATVFSEFGVSCEVVNLRTIKPLDLNTILASVSKCRRGVIWDIGHLLYGVSAEISSNLNESLFGQLLNSPLRFGLPDEPTPSSPFLASKHYIEIDHALLKINTHFALGISPDKLISYRREIFPFKTVLRDQPDMGQVGPF